MHIGYSIALALALAVTLPFWLLGMLRYGKYRAGLGARLGQLPPTLRATGAMERCIWVHAVSVGEVLAVAPLVERLKTKFAGTRIAVSTTTMTGHALALKKFGDGDVFYFPLDFSFALRPYFAHLRPSLVVVAETEFWPNFLRLAQTHPARVAVVNARISDRSFPRYRFFRGMLRQVLRNVDLFLAQSELDRERLVAIGAEAGRTQVGGNLKFDASVPDNADLAQRLRASMPASAPILVCGSTVEGEEELLLDAFQALAKDHSSLVMILAPRHPERFPEVVNLLVKRNVSFARRSAWDGAAIPRGVFLLDTIGELANVYRIANIAFVGGSLVPRGGHNILEPAQFGVPTLIGPHTENFRDIVTIFERASAVMRVDATSLLPSLHTWLDDPAAAQAMGARAREVYRSQSGAVERTLAALEVLLWMPETMRKNYQQEGQ
ncbi:MAG: 3-deoxy-D-manno-octulosonic acid transferase [Terriglobales bacterium]